jgi:ferredoxin
MTAVVRFLRGATLLGQAPCDPTSTLLQHAERAGLSLAYNCTSGTCGSCMVTLLTGTVTVPDDLPPGLDDVLVDEGARLACIQCPKGDVDVDVRPPI